MSLSKLKILVNLARIDGDVADPERKFIITIGQANGIAVDEINPLFNKDHEIIVPSNLTADQRFDYILSLVQLMKIDERLYAEEIRYCSQVATKLGYDQAVLFELLLHVRPGMEVKELESLKQLAAKYIIPG